MTRSVQAVGDRVEELRDADVIVLVALLERALQYACCRYRVLPLLVWLWQKNLEEYGPGKIHLDLTGLLSDPAARAELLSALAQVEREIASFGVKVSASTLRPWIRARGFESVREYQASDLVDTIGRLKSLMR
jgi:hypothetical protein